MGVAAVLLSSSLSMLESLKGLGFIGRLAYMLGLSLWVVICGPTTPIEVASGFVFPIYLSTVMSVVGKTMGNIMAFVLGRHLLKPMVSRMLMRGGGTSRAVHIHLQSELRQRPIQTMSILRAAPLPTPFKIYGLCLFPSELVPLPHYMCIALVFNTCWSVVWSLAGSTANNLHDVISGQGSGSNAAIFAKVSTFLGLFGAFTAFARFAKAQLQPPGGLHLASSSSSPPAAGLQEHSHHGIGEMSPAPVGVVLASNGKSPASGAKRRGRSKTPTTRRRSSSKGR